MARRGPKVVGRFRQRGVTGRNTRRFSGKAGKKRLEPGSYRASLVARDPSGNRSKAKRLLFTVAGP